MEVDEQTQVVSDVHGKKTPQQHDTIRDGQPVAARQEGRRQLPEYIILRRLWRIYEMALAAADRSDQAKRGK